MLSVNGAAEVARILERGTDSRSDIYSLGATLIHLLTGKAPANAPTRALSVWSGRVDPLRAGIYGRVPDGIATVLLRSMELNPESRPSAAQMRAALRRAREPQTRLHSSEAETVLPTVIDIRPTQYASPQISHETRPTPASPPPTQAAPGREAVPSLPTIAAPVQPAPSPPSFQNRVIEIPVTSALNPSLPTTSAEALKVPKYAYALAVASGLIVYLFLVFISFIYYRSEMYLTTSDMSIALLIFIIFPSLVYSALGAAFGYKWPGIRWKWGLLIATIPSLLMPLMIWFTIPSLLIPMIIILDGLDVIGLYLTSVLLILIVALAIINTISACLAAGLTAWYSLRRMTI